MNELFERVKGALVGCAYGDAMGMPTEFMRREDILELFPDGVDTFYASTDRDFLGRKMQAGEVTDDTINTVLIIQMLIDYKGEISSEGYLKYLQEWVKEHPEKNDVVSGPSTKRALAALENGTPLEKAGILGTTNGSAMKISPIGIVSDYRDLNQLVENVYKICMPTHNNAMAIAGASAIAACVSYCIRGGKDIEDLWKLALEAAKLGKKKGFQMTSASLERRIQTIKKLVDTQPYDVVIDELQNLYGTGVETIETIPSVLAVVQLANGDPTKSARISANIGADTDTIGAISTAICGAMNQSFDSKDIELLETVNQLNFDELAKQLLPYIQII